LKTKSIINNRPT